MTPRPWVASAAVAILLTSVGSSADEDACIAASQSSLTLRHQGKLHEALRQLAICADASCPGEVKAECGRRMAIVRDALPSVVFAAKDGAGNDLSAVRVTMDGATLTTTLDGRSITIDPGEHSFTFEAAGKSLISKKLVIREGEKERQETVFFGPMAPTAAASADRSTVPPPPSSTWTGRKTLAVITGGAGLVGVGLGAYFAAFAKSSQNMEASACASAAQCANPAQSQQDYSTAKEDATASTVSFVVGAALVAGGIVLWVTAPSADAGAAGSVRRGVRVAPLPIGRGGGLSVGGEL